MLYKTLVSANKCIYKSNKKTFQLQYANVPLNMLVATSKHPRGDLDFKIQKTAQLLNWKISHEKKTRFVKILPCSPAVTDIRQIKTNKFILGVIFYSGIPSVVRSILYKSVDVNNMRKLHTIDKLFSIILMPWFPWRNQ